MFKNWHIATENLSRNDKTISVMKESFRFGFSSSSVALAEKGFCSAQVEFNESSHDQTFSRISGESVPHRAFY